MIRKLSAHFIFPVSGTSLKLGIIICDAQGNIVEIVDTKGKFKEEPFLEFYNGIIVPGFLSVTEDNDFAIFNRLKDQQAKEPSLPLEQMIREVTLDMAKSLNCDLTYGTLEVNKKPGINLISGVDFALMKLTPKSQLKILVHR